MKARVALFIPALVAGTVACDATTELTKAPFELTSTVVNPTIEFTSSTSPGANPLINPARARQHVETFVAYSYDDVRADIARGNGEYLASLAMLAGVPAASQEAFRMHMQRNYGAMYDSSLSTKEEDRARVVNTAWSAGYGRENGSREFQEVPH